MSQTRKLYIGIALGVIITFIIPIEQIERILQPIVDVIINIGRYIFLPTMFFGIIASFAHHMRSDKRKKPAAVETGGAKVKMYTKHFTPHV